MKIYKIIKFHKYIMDVSIEELENIKITLQPGETKKFKFKYFPKGPFIISFFTGYRKYAHNVILTITNDNNNILATNAYDSQLIGNNDNNNILATNSCDSQLIGNNNDSIPITCEISNNNDILIWGYLVI